jgi:hypothetical protein
MLEATRLIPALFHNVPECIVALGERRIWSLDKKLLPARELCRAHPKRTSFSRNSGGVGSFGRTCRGRLAVVSCLAANTSS